MCHSAKIMSEIFFIAAILPVSVIFVIIRYTARASRWQPIVLISPPFNTYFFYILRFLIHTESEIYPVAEAVFIIQIMNVYECNGKNIFMR